MLDIQSDFGPEIILRLTYFVNDLITKLLGLNVHIRAAETSLWAFLCAHMFTCHLSSSNIEVTTAQINTGYTNYHSAITIPFDCSKSNYMMYWHYNIMLLAELCSCSLSYFAIRTFKKMAMSFTSITWPFSRFNAHLEYIVDPSTIYPL